jgi:hypothetical protein
MQQKEPDFLPCFRSRIEDMDEPFKWRTLLGELTRDPQERQRIANAVSVNPITITRWVTNRSSPRLENIRQLLDALPRHREHLFPLLLEEYPVLLKDEQEPVERLQEIPPAFYARVLASFTTSPLILRSSTILALILQQMSVHLDPSEQSIMIGIAQCVPPAPGQKVRSLRQVAGHSTLQRKDYPEHHIQFLGAESQAGHSVMTGRLIMAQSFIEKARKFTIHHPSGEGSSVACPILKADNATGCLYVFAPVENYFTPQHLDLIRGYANMLLLAFDDSEFYNLEEIDLGIMPPRHKQIPLFARFPECVTRYMLRFQAEGRVITRPQAEQIIWKEIEEELLHMPFSEDEE